MPNLSTTQRSILRWLLNAVHVAEQHNPQLLETGFPWNPATKNKANENVWRASLCRALARLERRGLIIRVKGPKKARTVRVILTREGHKVAEAINS